MKVFKYIIENELKNLKNDVDISKEYLDKIFIKQNRIIIFNNRKEKFYWYYCTNCKKWHVIHEPLKKGDLITCGNCRTRLEVIYNRNVIPDSNDYLVKIEKNDRKEIILRVFYVSRRYNNGLFDDSILEVARININHDVAMKNNTYTAMGWYGELKHRNLNKDWIRDKSEWYLEYKYNHVLNKQIKRFLKDTNYKYSALDIIVKKMDINILRYLQAYKFNPYLEMLAKFGCFNLIRDIVYRYSRGWASRFINNKDKSLIRFIQKNKNITLDEIEVFNKVRINDYGLIKDLTSFNWNDYDDRFKRFNSYKLNYQKIVNYLKEQSWDLSIYYDYLKFADDLGMDLSNKKVAFPDDLKKEHDELMIKHMELEKREFDDDIKNYSKELEQFIYQDDGYIIRPARSQSELIVESKILNHCVRTYAERMAQKKTSIFLIRENERISVPLCTLELINGKVIQCRAKNNKKPEEPVIEFVNTWCNKNNFKSCFS